MDSFFLETKLRIPPQPQRVVHRTRLINFLEDTLPRYKLILMAVAAGYGKTTTLA